MREFCKGDEVTVKGIVDHVTDDWIVVDFGFGAHSFRLGVRTFEIDTPRPFERGDKVTWGSGNAPWEFLMRYGDHAFVGRNGQETDRVLYKYLRPEKGNDKCEGSNK